jgi:phage gp16-like protein
MDVPLLYGLVAARQIIKHAQVGTDAGCDRYS